MSTLQPPLVTGMVLGGVLVSALGAGAAVVLEEKQPSVKGIVRDFIIGAVMLLMVFQLLPESATSMVNFLLALAPLSLFSASGNTQKGGAEGESGAPGDLEVKVGVPRF
jgi:hypothetical protein